MNLTVSFAADPLPSPVESVSGLDAPESWGRWSNDGRVTVRFSRELPERFQMRIACAVASANVGRVITVLAGRCCRRFVSTRTLSRGLEIASLAFRCTESARSVEILLPDYERGGVIDTRPLGLALSSLTIEETPAHG